MAIESEMLADAANVGLRIKEVEIGVRYDVNGSTEHPIKHNVRVLVNILHDTEFRRPLYYFTIPGIVLSAIGIVMGMELLRIFFRRGSLQYGPALPMVLLTLIGSFMALTGIILHILSRMIDEAKEDFKVSGGIRNERSSSVRNLARDD